MNKQRIEDTKQRIRGRIKSELVQVKSVEYDGMHACVVLDVLNPKSDYLEVANIVADEIRPINCGRINICSERQKKRNLPLF